MHDGIKIKPNNIVHPRNFLIMFYVYKIFSHDSKKRQTRYSIINSIQTSGRIQFNDQLQDTVIFV